MGIVATGRDLGLLTAIRELSDYLGEDVIATAVNVGNSFYLVAEEWERSPPRTPAEVRQFYRTSRAYLWNLTLANYAIGHQARLRADAAEAAAPGMRVLDVGAGIGSTIIDCARAGLLVHADVGGTLADYAAWRYARRGMAVEFRELPDRYLLEGEDQAGDSLAGDEFDVVVCTEVVEHVPDPEALVAWLSRRTASGGILFATASFEDDHGLFPCHLNVDKYTTADFQDRVIPAAGFRRVGECAYVRL